MSSNIVDVKYAIAEEVLVLGLNSKGCVTEINIAIGNALQYRVVYWVDSARAEAWFYDFEIGVLNEN